MGVFLWARYPCRRACVTSSLHVQYALRKRRRILIQHLKFNILLVVVERRRRRKHRKRAAPFLLDPRFMKTRTPGPVALAAVTRQTVNDRRASLLRKARFDASSSAPSPHLGSRGWERRDAPSPPPPRAPPPQPQDAFPLLQPTRALHAYLLGVGDPDHDDLESSVLVPLSVPAPSPHTSTQISASSPGWHQANQHSVAALSPDILPGVSETKGATARSFCTHACLRLLICARRHRFFP